MLIIPRYKHLQAVAVTLRLWTGVSWRNIRRKLYLPVSVFVRSAWIVVGDLVCVKEEANWRWHRTFCLQVAIEGNIHGCGWCFVTFRSVRKVVSRYQLNPSEVRVHPREIWSTLQACAQGLTDRTRYTRQGCFEWCSTGRCLSRSLHCQGNS